ncbi:tetratricopeptide repeat protein [Chitinimonas sp. PSY-7]|uniref:tetratricopeptide repeat protein n=1 Tax=Chitinimonas sp. PSY-7 TaxID=3459088 RepID=UPI004040053F
MSHYSATLCSLLIAAGLLSGCASTVDAKRIAEKTSQALPANNTDDADADTDNSEVNLPEEETSYPKQALNKELLFGFLIADVAAQRGDKTFAANTWLELARATKDPRAARRALELNYSSGNLGSALSAAQLWRQLEPQKLPPRQVLLNLLARSSRLQEAETELSQWLADRPMDAPSIFLQANTLWPAQADKQTVLQLTQRLATPYPKLPEAAMATALAANNAGETELALASADKAVQLKPDWESAILYRAAITETKSPEEAIVYLRSASQRLPKSREIKASLAKELAEAKQFEEARQVYSSLSAAYPNEVEYPIGEALAAIQMREYAPAEVALGKALKLGVRKPDALRYYLGIVTEEQFKLTTARDHYALVGDGELGVQATTRLARIEAKLGNKTAALAALQRLPNHTEADQIARLQLEGQLWREMKDLLQARTTLDKGLQTFPDNTDFLYDRSLILEQMGELDAAEKDLRHYLKLKPDNPLGLNALGYTLANRTQRFEEAESLLRKALDKEPDNPVILDSMGWLELRRGNIGQAINWLKQAYRGLPDPEIAAHYGEALWRNGQHSEARKIWAEGRKLDPAHEVLLETIQRLGAK